MVFGKFKAKEEPFDTQGLEALSPEEQERVLTKVATKEANIIEAKKKAIESKRAERVEAAVKQRIKILESKEDKPDLRGSLIKKEAARKAARAKGQAIPLRRRLQSLRPTDPRLGLPTKALGLPLLKKLPPSNAQLKVRAASQNSRLIQLNVGANTGTKAKEFQDKLRDKINAANKGTSPTLGASSLIGIKSSSKLKAPPTLL